jgi:hypothetical protein
MLDRSAGLETARRSRTVPRSIVASLAASCIVGFVVVGAFADPALGTTTSISSEYAVSPHVTDPSCPPASLLNSHLGTDVSLNMGGKGQCFYWKRSGILGTEIIMYIEPRSDKASGISFTEECGGRAPKPCRLAPLKDPGTVASYWTQSGGHMSGVNILEQGWLVVTEFYLGGPGGVQGGLQTALNKVESLSKSLTLPAAPPPVTRPTTTTTTTTPLMPISSLTCAGVCAIAVGDGQVALSWPDSGDPEYGIQVYVNGVENVAEELQQSQLNLQNGQEYFEVTVNKGTVYFVLTPYSGSQSTSNSVVIK